jgi:hypothetical protein
MPKSRHRKGKFSPQSKKRREPVRQPATPKPPAAAQAGESVSRPKIVTPPPRAATPTARTAAVPITSHNVTTELKTIGILAGILLVILVVLALFLA